MGRIQITRIRVFKQLAKLNMVVFYTLAVSSHDICFDKKKTNENPQSSSQVWHEIRDENIHRSIISYGKNQKKHHWKLQFIIHETNKQTVLRSTGVFLKAQRNDTKTKLFIDIQNFYNTFIKMMNMLLCRIRSRQKNKIKRQMGLFFTLSIHCF